MRALELLLPSAGALFFFALVLRAVFNADRTEREAAAHYDRLASDQKASDDEPDNGSDS